MEQDANILYTQCGHSRCERFTRPHAEHLFRFVRSSIPLPAMNRCLFFRCDVFFFGTAFSIPSHMSDSDGIDGRLSDGSASAANGVGSNRKGCERR